MENLSYEEQKKSLSKFGKVKTICQSVYNYEFVISEGFDSSVDNVMAFIDIAKKIAGERYDKIESFDPIENGCILILTKK